MSDSHITQQPIVSPYYSSNPVVPKVGTPIRQVASLTTGVAKIALIGIIAMDGLFSLSYKAFDQLQKDPALWVLVHEEQRWMEEQGIAPSVHLAASEKLTAFDGSAFFQYTSLPHLQNIQIQGFSGMVLYHLQQLLSPSEPHRKSAPASIVFGKKMHQESPAHIGYTLRHEHTHLYQKQEGAVFSMPQHWESLLSSDTAQMLSDFLNLQLLQDCQSLSCESTFAKNTPKPNTPLLKNSNTHPLLLGYYEESLADARALLLTTKKPNYQPLEMNQLALEVYQYRTTGTFGKSTSESFSSNTLFAANGAHNVSLSAFLVAQIPDATVQKMSLPQINQLAQEIASWSTAVTLLREAVHNHYFKDPKILSSWQNFLAPVGYSHAQVQKAHEELQKVVERYDFFAPPMLESVNLPSFPQIPLRGLEIHQVGWAYYGLGGQMTIPLHDTSSSRSGLTLYMDSQVSHFFTAIARFTEQAEVENLDFSWLEHKKHRAALTQWLEQHPDLKIDAISMQYSWLHFQYARTEQQFLIDHVTQKFKNSGIAENELPIFSQKLLHPFFLKPTKPSSSLPKP